ncbi:MAG: DUF1887 family protein [Pontiellaceae bacterium]|nr:DUF1887 family protein [Pontiellaceae bacterium]
MTEKILINLLSEQTLPNYIAIKEIQPDRVLALATPEFKAQMGLLQKETGVQHMIIKADAYDFRKNFAALSESLNHLPPDADVIVNFTGGTKVMSLAAGFSAFAHARKGQVTLVYIDSLKGVLEWLPFSSTGQLQLPEQREIQTAIPFVVYANLKNERIAFMQEHLEEGAARMPLYAALADHGSQALLKKEKQHQLQEVDGRFKGEGEIGFAGTGRLKWNRTGAELVMPSGRHYGYVGNDAAEFFCGRWLEEYAFHLLAQSGSFDQVLGNVVLSLRPETIEKLRGKRQGMTDKNEIDVVVCKGLRAVLIECKAGNVLQDHIYKLDTLRKYLLGPFGVSLLLCRHEPNPGVQEKARDLGIEILVGSRGISDVVGRVRALLGEKISTSDLASLKSFFA